MAASFYQRKNQPFVIFNKQLPCLTLACVSRPTTQGPHYSAVWHYKQALLGNCMVGSGQTTAALGDGMLTSFHLLLPVSGAAGGGAGRGIVLPPGAGVYVVIHGP